MKQLRLDSLTGDGLNDEVWVWLSKEPVGFETSEDDWDVVMSCGRQSVPDTGSSNRGSPIIDSRKP